MQALRYTELDTFALTRRRGIVEVSKIQLRAQRRTAIRKKGSFRVALVEKSSDLQAFLSTRSTQHLMRPAEMYFVLFASILMRGG